MAIETIVRPEFLFFNWQSFQLEIETRRHSWHRERFDGCAIPNSDRSLARSVVDKQAMLSLLLLVLPLLSLLLSCRCELSSIWLFLVASIPSNQTTTISTLCWLGIIGTARRGGVTINTTLCRSEFRVRG